MSMNPNDLNAVVVYVENNPGCSEEDIRAAFPKMANLSSLLSEASEGGNANDKGYILEQRNGLYYPGPNAHLGHFNG